MTEFEITSYGIVCRGEFLMHLQGMGGLNVKDVKKVRLPLLWSTVGEAALAKGFCSNMGGTKYPCVCGTMNCLEGVYTVRIRSIPVSPEQ